MSVVDLKPRMSPNAPAELNLRRTIFISFGFLSVLTVDNHFPVIGGNVRQ